jgi:predicted nucleotidyltransferase component of viral defense system
VPGLLAHDDLLRVSAQFGVDDEQVVRDHAISHILAAIATLGTEEIVFFGGTALSRSLLPNTRLSEDIDLIARADRAKTGDQIEDAVSRALRSTLGSPSFSPRLRDTRHAEPSSLYVGGATIQIQLLSAEGYPAWPTEVVDVEQRFADAPPARLRVLTPPAFVASKLSSWADRAAARDLYDLWALAEAGEFSPEAVALFGRLGPFTRASSVSFSRVPTAAEWRAALGHQCRLAVAPDEAARVVIDALRTVEPDRTCWGERRSIFLRRSSRR